MIYTSYFGNYKNFPKNSYVVGVTRFPPDGVENCAALAPSDGLLKKFKNKEIDEFVFSIKYLEELNRLDKVEWKEYFRHLEYVYENIILCCYEKTGEFCHRHILNNWLDGDGEI